MVLGTRSELLLTKAECFGALRMAHDNLYREDLGGDIHNGNPAEELNRFDGPIGSHYGYPYCFSSYALNGYSPLTQFAWPTFMNDGIHSDEWCRNTTNVI